jgi:NDP-sugar pyrophosphorylase family protein
MILCAGLGTRPGASSEQRPKPPLPVCDRPILEYGIANLVAHDVTEIVFNLHHKGDVIRRTIGDGARLGARIQYVDARVTAPMWSAARKQLRSSIR